MIEFSEQQQAAMATVADFIHFSDEKICQVDGFAGTGKTTLAKHLAEGVRGYVPFVAFTGKAASVLASKGCHPASTFHSQVYQPKSKCEARLEALQLEFKDWQMSHPKDDRTEADEDKAGWYRDEIRKEADNVNRPSFAINYDSGIRDAAVVFLDEHYMADRQMGEDLAGFGVKVVALGDPAQLPPVAGRSWLAGRRAEVMLTDVHRQAEGNPVLWAATRLRNHEGMPPPGEYGDRDELVIKNYATDDDLTAADILLCGRNKTRAKLNARKRELLGFSGTLPKPGERLVCLRNNNDLGLMNGTIWELLEIEPVGGPAGKYAAIEVQDDAGNVVRTRLIRSRFEEDQPVITPQDRRMADDFDFGYCLTVHKSQGSEWRHVLLVDEHRAFNEDGDGWRWLYTGVTRASEVLKVVRA